MQIFIRKPSIDFVAGVKVDKDTTLEFKNDHVNQKLSNLVFRSVTNVNGDGFESTYDTTIHLKEGDVLVFEEEGRGYIKPVEDFVTVDEAIDEIMNIKDLR